MKFFAWRATCQFKRELQYYPSHVLMSTPKPVKAEHFLGSIFLRSDIPSGRPEKADGKFDGLSDDQ